MRDRYLRDRLIAACGRLGIHAVKRTKAADLGQLIADLAPIDCGRPLIRLGPDGDGGYLLPDDLDGIADAFSPGVSTESGFERDLAQRGINVHMADFSVDAPALASPRFTFEKRFVTSYPTATTMTMDQWVATRAGDTERDLLLQMDIEGAEFEVLLNMSPDLLRRFRILIIEFHYLHQLWNKPWFLQVRRVFDKLLAGHRVVHIHPNNCCGSFRSAGLDIPRVAEFTLLRRDRCLSTTPRSDFPHPLDRDNTRKPTLPLPACWHGG